MVMGDPALAADEAHYRDCDDCRAFVAQLQAFDELLREAMQIDAPQLAPASLPEPDAKVRGLPARRSRMPFWLAMAATLLVAAFLGLRAWLPAGDGLPLPDEILAHMTHEPGSRVVSASPVSDRRLARVVPASVAELSHEGGLITYAQSCVINGHRVPHLVIQGETGPVTVILLPDEKIEQAMPLRNEQFHGVLLPVGDGSIAILAENEEEDLERIRQRMQRSVSWRT